MSPWPIPPVTAVGEFTAAGPPPLQEATRITTMDPTTTLRKSVFRTKLPMLRMTAAVRYVADVRYLLITAAAALFLSGCGSYLAGSTPPSTPTPSIGTGLGYDVVVTEKDKAATLRVGQKVEVVFHAASGMESWTHVKSSNESVLTPIVNPAATAVRGVTLAAFKASSPGQAEITAYASPQCSPGSACPMYVAVVSIKVTVTS
jgi:hypothetical protein